MATPLLFDRPALIRHRARATVDVLRRAVIADLQDRLAMVNKPFTCPAVVTGWPAVWDGVLPGAVIVPDTETLDLRPGAHDLVIHDMGLHWANDPVGQLVQARLALRPDGLLIATLFGGRTLHELRAALGQAEINVTGGLSPRVAPMGDVRDLGALLSRAGLALPVADVTPFTLTYPDALSLMRDLRAMGEGNAMTGRLRHATRRAVMTGATSAYADQYVTPDGRIPATFEVVTLTGWAPSPDQPQPLRPGSAKTRLADALRVPERPLPPNGD
jgi:SAM-dependent methyltransferase